MSCAFNTILVSVLKLSWWVATGADTEKHVTMACTNGLGVAGYVL